MPELVAAHVTEAIPIPTIGIGAGAACDGQVLVLHDVLGLSDRTPPRFVRQYADLATAARDAIAAYAADVRSGAFPTTPRPSTPPPSCAGLLTPTTRGPEPARGAGVFGLIRARQ